jgi:RNA polymerase sigma-70 factor (ECF subfamily)
MVSGKIPVVFYTAICMSNNLIKKFKDKQAISRLKSKDKEAFIGVYDENSLEINRFIYFKVGNREEADDLTSLVFLKTWNHIQNKTLTDAKTLRALLYKIARNVVIDYYRSAGTKNLSLNDEENPLDVIDEEKSPESLQADLDQAADIKLIMSKLPLLKDEYREVIIMKFVSDLSLEEIADISGKTKGNIRVLIYRALKALKELVEEV